MCSNGHSEENRCFWTKAIKHYCWSTINPSVVKQQFGSRNEGRITVHFGEINLVCCWKGVKRKDCQLIHFEVKDLKENNAETIIVKLGVSSKRPIHITSTKIPNLILFSKQWKYFPSALSQAKRGRRKWGSVKHKLLVILLWCIQRGCANVYLLFRNKSSNKTY